MTRKKPASAPPTPQHSANVPAKVATPTAHLVGPGVLRVRNRMPCWEPLDGRPLLLHPERLRTVVVHGLADLTGAALRLLWRHGVQLSFLNRRTDRLLGRLSPPAEKAPALACWQHWALRDPDFVLDQGRRCVQARIQSIRRVARRLARRTCPTLKSLDAQLARDLAQLPAVTSLSSLRGHEGAASARWHTALKELFPPRLPYPGRRHRPAPDPVNALLSLGYTLLLARVQAAVCALGLDPLLGFYHQPRPGKPALVCDLMEPFRAPVVDQLVVALVRQGVFQAQHFRRSPAGVRLVGDHFRRFVKAFETRFAEQPARRPFLKQVHHHVEQFAADVRRWARTQPKPNSLNQPINDQ